MKTAIIIIVIVVLGFLFISAYKDKKIEQTSQVEMYSNENETAGINPVNSIEENINNTNIIKEEKIMYATLKTNMGDIKIEFFESDAPNTVANFTKLAGAGFYNGIKFHRVIKGFMNQAGDPNSKDDTKMDIWGTGGPGYKFADEINKTSDLYTKIGYKKGILAMANSGLNTNGSQFLIMAENYPLSPLYTIFGEVTAGIDVVTAINNVSTDENDRPLTAVVINSIVLE